MRLLLVLGGAAALSGGPRAARLSPLRAMRNEALAESLDRAALLRTSEGCWAGWEVSFSARDGKAEALDASYVSEDLLEWGQVPLGWEVYSRDDFDGELCAAWTRSSFRVLPEAGCAADEVAVAANSAGVDLGQATVRALAAGDILVVDTRRYPSGETTAAIGASPPFVEARSLFYGEPGAPRRRDGAGAPLLARYDRVRVELKLDPTCAAFVKVAVFMESRVACGPPFSSKRKPGSSRATGLDATTVSKQCGKCFVSAAGDGSADYGENGETTLSLASGRILLNLKPTEDGGCALDAELPMDGVTLRRRYAADGALLEATVVKA
mmetsp:Transcript_26330/g.88502  ORF Transcript_26330/g.88502 Transcript_26330/m.88502 type:complete len:325 (-) Transcript_26330:217-1191(-)